MTDTNPDRVVHARFPVTGLEVVRYDRAGKWYFEAEGHPRKLVKLDQAVKLVRAARQGDVIVYIGMSGRMRHFKLHVIARAEATPLRLSNIGMGTPIWVDDIDQFHDPLSLFAPFNVVLATARPAGPWLPIERAYEVEQRRQVREAARQRAEDAHMGLRLLIEAATDTDLAPQGVNHETLGRSVREYREQW